METLQEKTLKKEGDFPLIVSITSHPPRFNQLHLTLISLIEQSLMPDKIVLWINESDRKLLPKEVNSLYSENFEIQFLSGMDLGPYTKIIPSLSTFPDSIIVTCDDDVVYYSNWLWDLYINSLHDNHSKIICHRARLIKFDKNMEIENYSNWNLLGPYDDVDSMRVFPTGIGGVLYPPNSLDKDVLNHAIFMKLCETNDDIWLYFMSTLLGISKRKIPTNYTNMVNHYGSQECGLWNTNQIENKNNSFLSNLIFFYNNTRHYDFIKTLQAYE
jgi:hypothetical protein